MVARKKDFAAALFDQSLAQLLGGKQMAAGPAGCNQHFQFLRITFHTRPRLSLSARYPEG